MRDLEGRTVVVTGGASGMGLAFAECFGREGMNVVLADIEEKALRSAAARVEALGASVLPVVTDAGDEASMDHLGEVTRQSFGKTDVVCLNAGVAAPTQPMETLTTNDWKWTLDVNLWGVIHGIRVFVPEMKARDEGHVVVTASVAGLTSYPWLGPYNASKHAATTIAETLYAELAEAGSRVGVSCLCPGLVATNIGDSARNRPKELENPPTTAGGAALDAAADDSDMAKYTDVFEKVARPAEDVAERVLAAVVEERFWIETDEFYRAPIRERHRAIEEQGEPPARGVILSPYFDH